MPPRFTKLVESLPATVPFVGPETLERDRGAPFAARLGANESVFGPSPRVLKAMEEADEAPIVIYHSHTGTEAYPSRTDVAIAAEPDAHYVLVSTRDPDEHELRSYRIVDGVVTEEPVKIVDQYQ